ncbi:hypothetical protein JCM3770_000695 [Rhodotorula araucariae]
MLDADWESVSSALGVASVVTWLFAQSPQVYLNFKSGSVEGLALPFLVSWFAGDFTNLVGCVLTHQLPFQTFLASYFIVVDVVLCAQFAYYSRIRPTPHFPPLSEDFPYAQPSPHASFVHARRSRSRMGRSRSSRTRLLHSSGAEESEEDPMVASWMTESSDQSTATSHHQPARPLPSRASSAATCVPPSPTVPERGRTLQRSAIRTFDPTLTTISGSPSLHTGFAHTGFAHAGLQGHVSFTREPDALLPAVETHQHQRTSSSRSRPPPPSRRSTSVVFLSVGALFTLGRLGGATVGTMDDAKGGRAWSTAPRPAEQEQDWWIGGVRHPAFFPSLPPPPSATLDAVFPPHSRRSIFPVDVSVPAFASASAGKPEEDIPLPPRHPPPPPPPFDWERVVGRTSAWICTTAYLTSRLPQIWQNFRRRSVEGLAMTLFFAAFLGNSLYVASILTNPLASTSGYLLESTPYLLGSGGTLCFDLMIIAQSWLYSDSRRARRDRDRRRRSAHGLDAEEEAALLDADDDADGDADLDGEATKHPRRGRTRRTRSASTLGYGRSVSTGGSSRRTLSTTRPAAAGAHRSDSTELVPGAARLARFVPTSRAERGILDDDPFDFGTAHDAESDAPSNRSVSHGRSSRGHSRAASIDATIAEESESAVTLRMEGDEV